MIKDSVLVSCESIPSRLVKVAALRMQSLIKTGATQEDARNQSGVLLVKAAMVKLLYPLPDDKILDRFKLKNFEFDVNSRKFSKLVENTMGKGEIAHYEQFLLFPQCFQKACFPGVSKGVIVWEWLNLNPLPYMPILGSSMSPANKDMMSEKYWQMGIQFSDWVEKNVGKEEIGSLRAISSFLTMVSKAVCCWCVKKSIYEVMG